MLGEIKMHEPKWPPFKNNNREKENRNKMPNKIRIYSCEVKIYCLFPCSSFFPFATNARHLSNFTTCYKVEWVYTFIEWRNAFNISLSIGQGRQLTLYIYAHTHKVLFSLHLFIYLIVYRINPKDFPIWSR